MLYLPTYRETNMTFFLVCYPAVMLPSAMQRNSHNKCVISDIICWLITASGWVGPHHILAAHCLKNNISKLQCKMVKLQYFQFCGVFQLILAVLLVCNFTIMVQSHRFHSHSSQFTVKIPTQKKQS